MQFLQLHDVIIHPVLSGIISFSFLLGIMAIVSSGGSLVFKRNLKPAETICAFMMVLGMFATVVHFLAIGKYISSWGLRLLGYPLCMAGIYYLSRNTPRLLKYGDQLYKGFKSASTSNKMDILLLGGTLFLFFLCVLGPPTDADSLDYHIGFPLDILRNGGIVVSPDWFHSRVIGLGEYLNLLGLGLRSDNLGAVLQFSGLCWLCWLVINSAVNSKNHSFLLKLILSAPVLLFLIPNQKPQFIGSVAIVAAAISVVGVKKLETSTLVLALGSLFFAMSLKYPFYLTGSGVLLFICYKAQKSQRLMACIGCSIIFYLGFLFPFHLGNFINYGDPISPLLSPILSPDGYEYKKLRLLSDFAKPGFEMPWGLLFPRSLGVIPTVIGGGLLVVFFIGQLEEKTREYLILSAYCLMIVLLLGVGLSRYFLESYFFLVMGLGACQQLRTKGIRLYSGCLSLQLLGVMFSLVVGAYVLFPGALSFPLREQTMMSAAHRYSAMRWLHKNLPENSFLISDFRSSALLPRPFLAFDYGLLIPEHEQEIFKILESTPHVENHYLVTDKISQKHPLFDYLENKEPIAQQQFPQERRNPFNKSGTYSLSVYRINYPKLLSGLSKVEN